MMWSLHVKKQKFFHKKAKLNMYEIPPPPKKKSQRLTSLTPRKDNKLFTGRSDQPRSNRNFPECSLPYSCTSFMASHHVYLPQDIKMVGLVEVTATGLDRRSDSGSLNLQHFRALR